MKIISYTPLLYGKQYLGYAIRSVVDYVDEVHILYTAQGSYTVPGDMPCPESRDELYAVASDAAGHKLRWHEGVWHGEGQHRNAISQYAPDTDVMIALDADEIWHESTIRYVAQLSPKEANVHSMRVSMIHYWRSFHRAILHDPAWPTRVIYPQNTTRDESTLSRVPINHMGYAQTPEIVGYKMTVHGHLNELRPNWFEDIFLDEQRTTDLHPVGSLYWNTEHVNFLDYMPAFMAAHEFASMDIIR